jgi:hypothetical protein
MERRAIKYVEAEEPPYTEALKIPDMVELLPYFENLFGTVQTSIRFTPCMQTVIADIRITSRMGYLENIKRKTVPKTKAIE